MLDVPGVAREQPSVTRVTLLRSPRRGPARVTFARLQQPGMEGHQFEVVLAQVLAAAAVPH